MAGDDISRVTALTHAASPIYLMPGWQSKESMTATFSQSQAYYGYSLDLDFKKDKLTCRAGAN